ncbi:MAG TPA: ion channel [Gemmatimonadaceae bacterium]|nr:ion channel [Gemmatimonadaceae bacterium]
MTGPRFEVVEEPKDLGFGTIVGGVNEQRLLNRDGTFNPRREGLPFLSSLSLYHYFLTLTWPRFFAVVVGAYVVANGAFAVAYLACGSGALIGTVPTAMGNEFWRAFFFSVETLATIGYGNVTPNGMPAHLVMTAESLAGLLFFAMATGILFARFSRPTAVLRFSERAVVTPYRNVAAFMFRVANARSNQLVELEAKVLFSRIEGSARRYDELRLERSRVTFFPLSWTVVHPIDESSPLHGVTHDELTAKDAEFMILITGIDETFSQTVHARSSYKPAEIAFGHRFVSVYNPVDAAGIVSIDVRRLSDTEPAGGDMAHTGAWQHTGHFAGYAPPRR